ncbi:hypothetical protein [uncultured Microbacterium sp.]|uniref:hypothetical protein n=1 Tax=uncultured Microbacterium sp. TaxID=191216 RepID=UPI0025F66553|nr:hypothetical protein [uncultured Microbacterium sp.]
MGLSIDIAANTSAAQRGIKDLSKTLDGVADALDDVADDAAKGGDRVERSFRDMTNAARDAGRKAADGADKITDALKDTERQAKRTERAVDDIGDARGLGKMKDAAQEVTQEVGQNLGEAVSSVRGNLSDLGQVGQDTLGGLAATLAGTGPAGIAGAAALAAGAVGLGVMTNELQKQQQEADELRDRLQAAYHDASDAGRAYLDIAQIIANQQDLINNPARADEYAKLLDTQKKTGLDMSTILKANAGDLDALRVVIDSVSDANKRATDAGDEFNVWTQRTNSGLQELNNYWKTTGESAQNASQQAAESIKFTNDLLMEQIGAASDAGVEVDDLNNKLVTLKTDHGDTKILIDAQTGQASLNVDKFRADADGVIDHVNGREVVIKATADTAEAERQLDIFRGMTIGVDVVPNYGPLKDGYKWGG